MKNLKSKLFVLVLLVCSMIFANCSNSSPQSNISPIKVAGTIWMNENEPNLYDYIVFNLDSTFVVYYAPIDDIIEGHYYLKDGKIILHQTDPNYDSYISKEDQIYVIIDNQMYFVEEDKISKGRPYTPAPKGWRPPAGEIYMNSKK